MRRRGFTLLELLVVIGMIIVLMSVMGAMVGKARNQARVSKATQEIKEINNAIIAYEQFAEGHTLMKHVHSSWTECNSSSMTMILGGERGENGEPIPALYNATMNQDRMVDPWGTPYEFRIEKSDELANGSGSDSEKTVFFTGTLLPNKNRLSPEERLP